MRRRLLASRLHDFFVHALLVGRKEDVGDIQAEAAAKISGKKSPVIVLKRNLNDFFRYLFNSKLIRLNMKYNNY